MNKEASVLKSEKNLLLKEKRIFEMRKKAQGILDTVNRETNAINQEIQLFVSCWRDINRGGFKLNLDGMEKRAETVVKLWDEF